MNRMLSNDLTAGQRAVIDTIGKVQQRQGRAVAERQRFAERYFRELTPDAE